MSDPTLSPVSRPPHASRPIIVLLVDDQPFTGTIVGLLLASEPDIELRCCLSALDAIATANQLAPTVVLQDLVMPDLDGMTLLRSFRTNPRTAGTAVIMLSANDDAATRARALGEGADDFLVKLPPKEQLIACIRDHASRSAGGEDTLDLDVIAGFHDAGTAFMSRLIDQFLEEARARANSLAEAAARDDESALHTLAHNLKGSARMMGAVRLGTLCARLELSAPPPGVRAALLAEIEREFGELQQALSAQKASISQP